ncbi:hypothetical protein LCGC14_1633400 [marine sediment metagenome]|uniref:Uncharacterized protein n=1 Tax=marine sediment metagenome TaxID=412755 RepID=A0A0F9IP87_9ZZZZ
MLIVIRVDIPYAYAHDMWKQINGLPDGNIYHRTIDLTGVKDHFFSDQPITDEQIDDSYE